MRQPSPRPAKPFRLDATAFNDAEGLEHVIELLVTLEACSTLYSSRHTRDDLKRI